MAHKSDMCDRERVQIITHKRSVELSMKTRDLDDIRNFPIPQRLVGTEHSIAEPGSGEMCSKTSRELVTHWQARILLDDSCGLSIEAERSGGNIGGPNKERKEKAQGNRRTCISYAGCMARNRYSVAVKTTKKDEKHLRRPRGSKREFLLPKREAASARSEKGEEGRKEEGRGEDARFRQ
ncbi:hypothetical protein K438DRAFT_1772150 [Mycena galopus ATCC 62051]|nr:hypothetical protein K438DRAFT_1772150 [Mycena galopus ATCC 62051]